MPFLQGEIAPEQLVDELVDAGLVPEGAVADEAHQLEVQGGDPSLGVAVKAFHLLPIQLHPGQTVVLPDLLGPKIEVLVVDAEHARVAQDGQPPRRELLGEDDDLEPLAAVLDEGPPDRRREVLLNELEVVADQVGRVVAAQLHQRLGDLPLILLDGKSLAEQAGTGFGIDGLELAAQPQPPRGAGLLAGHEPADLGAFALFLREKILNGRRLARSGRGLDEGRAERADPPQPRLQPVRVVVNLREIGLGGGHGVSFVVLARANRRLRAQRLGLGRGTGGAVRHRSDETLPRTPPKGFLKGVDGHSPPGSDAAGLPIPRSLLNLSRRRRGLA